MTNLAPAPLRVAPRRARARRIRRWAVVCVLVLMAVVLLGPRAVALVRPGVLPGTTVGGVEVGGLEEPALRAAVEELAAAREAAAITIRLRLVEGREEGQPAPLVAAAGDAGYRVDVEGTTAAALELGRQANPLRAWQDLLASMGEGRHIAPIDEIDITALDAWAEQTAVELGLEPVEGTLTIEGTDVRRVDPEPGVVVDVHGLAERTEAALLDPAVDTVEAPVEAVQPDTTAADVDVVEALATRAVSAPVELEHDGSRLVVEPTVIGTLLTVVPRDGDPRLGLDLAPSALPDALGAEAIAALEREPVDADIRLVDGAIVIGESAEGFRFDPDRAAAQILELATGEGARRAALDGEVVAPARSAEDAHALGIVEPTGTFTTEFTPGQSRVQNIQRIAELVDGVVLEPGETFSVNEHVGPRTEEKGFAPGGAIVDGEFVEEIGGGVSQFATTLYNAAYFGGYELVQYQAHSYYISRYPMGREATIDYPTIDLVIRNSSPYGLLIEATTTDSSVMVTTWGTPWVEVESVTGDPFNVRSGAVRDGFDVVDTRVLRYPDGREEREERFTRYRPES